MTIFKVILIYLNGSTTIMFFYPIFSYLKKYPFTLLTTSQTHPEGMKNQGGFCKSSEKGLADPARLPGHLA
jgi:hypothetical protein